MVGEVNLIDTRNLERFEVLEFPGSQRIAHREIEVQLLSMRIGLCRVIWRGWASNEATALDAAPAPGI